MFERRKQSLLRVHAWTFGEAPVLTSGISDSVCDGLTEKLRGRKGDGGGKEERQTGVHGEDGREALRWDFVTET